MTSAHPSVRLTAVRHLAVGLAVLAAGLASVAQAVPAAATASEPAAATAAPRSFSCSGILGRAYTRQTVTGTLTGVRPTDVTTSDYLGTVLVSTPRPKAAPHWWGGLFSSSQDVTQWALGSDSRGDTFHLMLPASRPGASFTAELVTEFGPGGTWGNWQNVMTCTAS